MSLTPIDDIKNALIKGQWEAALQLADTLRSRQAPASGDDLARYIQYARLMKTGLAHAQEHQGEDAIRCIREAIALIPALPSAYNPLGNLYLEQGQFGLAENIYRQAVHYSPDSPYAWCNLGIAILAQERIPEAFPPLQKSIALKSDFAYAHAMLGDAWLATGDAVSGQASYRQAHQLDPENPAYLETLGNLAMHLNQPDSAVLYFRALLDAGHRLPGICYALGNALAALGRLDEAMDAFGAAIQLDPDFGLAYNNLGSLQHAQRDYERAQSTLRQATERLPDYAPAWANFGNALIALGQIEQAITALSQAITLDETNPDAQGLLGKAYYKLNRLPEAEHHLRRALELNPVSGYFTYAFDLAVILKDQGRWSEALAMSRETITMNPGFADAYTLVAFILYWQEQFDEAQQYASRALELDPETDAHIVLGNTYLHQGKFQEACTCFKQAIARDATNLNAYANLLHSLGFVRDCTPQDYLDTAHQYGQCLTAAATPYTDWKALANAETLPLRVGIVSGDLHNHPVGYFIAGLLPCLDRQKIELIAFASRQLDDELSRRIRPQFREWHQVSEGNIAAAAEVMHAANLHILLDLNGHTAFNMLPAFAWRPAPVQASWLGYWASTGVAEMDYLIADPVSVPPAHQSHFTEHIWYLPDTRLCFTPPAGAPATISPPPVLKNGYVTFGCFQRLSKLNDDVLSVWRQIFAVCPNARLHLKSGNLLSHQAQQALFAQLSAHGFRPDQVHLESGSSREAYLRSYEQVDFMLDTFPFPGGTTTCEALWMGVPTLTLTGDSLLQRQGESLLTAAGLTDWIARAPKDYVRLACQHAANPQALAELRAGLRSSVSQSALFDAPRFARHLEQALIGMWQHGSARRRASQPGTGE